MRYFKLLLLGFFLLYQGCETINTTDARSSKSIIDSKRKKLFINSYSVDKNIIRSDSVNFEIIESWSEYVWYYDNLFGAKTIEKDTQLVIRVNKLSSKEYHLIAILNKLGYSGNGHEGNLILRRTKLEDTTEVKFANIEKVIFRKL